MRTILPLSIVIILLAVRITCESFVEDASKGHSGAAEMTSWTRRHPANIGDWNLFYQAGVAEGLSRTPWMGWNSLDDKVMCVDSEKIQTFKRRGWGKRRVLGGDRHRSFTEDDEGIEIPVDEGGGREKPQVDPALMGCAYWKKEARNRIYNAGRAVKTREHVCKRENKKNYST